MGHDESRVGCRGEASNLVAILDELDGRGNKSTIIIILDQQYGGT